MVLFFFLSWIKSADCEKEAIEMRSRIGRINFMQQNKRQIM
jgi:hypothetical protein